VKRFKTLGGVKPAPMVAIVNTPFSVNTEEATVTLEIADMGGGIGDVRLYKIAPEASLANPGLPRGINALNTPFAALGIPTAIFCPSTTTYSLDRD